MAESVALPRFVKVPYRADRVKNPAALEGRLLRQAKTIQLDAEAAAWEDDCDEGFNVPERSEERRVRSSRLAVTVERYEKTLDPRYMIAVVLIREGKA